MILRLPGLRTKTTNPAGEVKRHNTLKSNFNSFLSQFKLVNYRLQRLQRAHLDGLFLQLMACSVSMLAALLAIVANIGFARGE